MAALVSQSLKAAGGTTPTYAAAGAGGDTVPNPGSNCFLHVKNASASPVTVTIAVVGTLFNSVAHPATAVVVAASTEKFIPITAEYKNANNVAAVTYSAVTTVTVAALLV